MYLYATSIFDNKSDLVYLGKSRVQAYTFADDFKIYKLNRVDWPETQTQRLMSSLPLDMNRTITDIFCSEKNPTRLVSYVWGIIERFEI